MRTGLPAGHDVAELPLLPPDLFPTSDPAEVGDPWEPFRPSGPDDQLKAISGGSVPADPRPCGPQLVGADTAASQSQQLPVTFVLALLAASAALVVTFAACGRRSKYAPTEVEIPPLDPDESYEDAALV